MPADELRGFVAPSYRHDISQPTFTQVWRSHWSQADKNPCPLQGSVDEGPECQLEPFPMPTGADVEDGNADYIYLSAKSYRVNSHHFSYLQKTLTFSSLVILRLPCPCRALTNVKPTGFILCGSMNKVCKYCHLFHPKQSK